ncbi:MAG TPA: hypothetical protein VJO33_07855 [Gemmatimonadaceae bacterium]|nr:hypothetical protein [Gemmatimonadaceae bacterium]
MRLSRCLLLSPFVVLAAAHASAQVTLPELKFEDPPAFYRSAIYPPADFSSREVNASLQVYPFQPFAGNVQQAFSRTLFRELIDPRYQESSVAPGAKLDMSTMPGARMVLRARYQEVVVGLARERMRMVVIADGAIAIVDAQAISLTSWQHVLPQLNAFASTLRVVAGTPEPAYGAPPGTTGRVIAGLYMGFARKYMTDLQRGPASGYYTNALQYYVFSADGRVYRHYDELRVPGNDPARFDFAGAERADPVNSGRYAVQGDSVYVRLRSPQRPEKFAMAMPRDNSIMIGTVSYKRQ